MSTDIAAERARYYRASRWSGPVGTGSAAALWAALVSNTGTPPQRLGPWLVGIAVVVALQILAFTGSLLTRRVAADGLPVVGHIAHAGIGAGFGATLWLDLESTEGSEFRWITLACLFAMSAGVVSGFSGVNRFGQLVAIPMWFGAATALLATGHWLAALAGGVFAAITVRDMTANGLRWTELFELRIRSERAASEHQWAASHDSLTRLTNRHGLRERLDDLTTGRRTASVLLVDLDHFKEVNDGFGHAAGDDVLRTVADRLVGCVRSGDLVGRLGGDEFCIVAENASRGRADDIAERLISLVEQPIDGSWGPEPVFISASVGIAFIDGREQTSDDVMLEADYALYEAKRSGRRQRVHFDENLRAEVTGRMGLESELRRAIRNRAIHAEAQPIFDLNTGAVVSVELLARWQLGSTLVPPNLFIPIAESTGLIGDLTDIMFEIAGRHLVRWSDQPELADARVAINISPMEFRRGSVADRVRDALDRYHIPPERLILEVTESRPLDATAALIEQMGELRDIGVRLAIDDFGTGYSSLDQLLSLEAHAVKLDRSITAKLGADDRQPALVRTIHDLAAVIGSTVVVEGIENADQLRLLRDLGTRFGQGYHLCRPVPIDKLSDRIRASAPRDEISAGTPAAARRGAGSNVSSSE